MDQNKSQRNRIWRIFMLCRLRLPNVSYISIVRKICKMAEKNCRYTCWTRCFVHGYCFWTMDWIIYNGPPLHQICIPYLGYASGFSCFATGSSCLLYDGPLVGSCFWNDSWYVSSVQGSGISYRFHALVHVFLHYPSFIFDLIFLLWNNFVILSTLYYHIS